MPEWLEIYLNWWRSQAEKLTEMTLIDFVVLMPLALLPLVLLFLFIVEIDEYKHEKGS